MTETSETSLTSSDGVPGDRSSAGLPAGRAADSSTGDRRTTLTASLPDSPGTPLRTASEEIVVIDYGGQYSQLIARRVRDCGVFSELLPHHVGLEEVVKRKPRGIVLSGGPASVYAPGA